MMASQFLWMLSLTLIGHAAGLIYSTQFQNTTWDDENWRLQKTFPDAGHFQGRPNLANGYIGISTSALGPFFERETPVNNDDIGGWPLNERRQTFATIAGFYDEQAKTDGTNFVNLYQYGGESIIAGLPHWSGLLLICDGHTLNASTSLDEITGFTSTWDFGAGSFSWKYTWTPPASPAFDIEYSLFLHKLHINHAATRLKVTSSRDSTVSVVDSLDGNGAIRSFFLDSGMEPDARTIWSAVQPNNTVGVTGYIYSTIQADASTNLENRRMASKQIFDGNITSSIGQQVDVDLIAGQTSVIDKHVGIASNDAFVDPRSVARNASRDGAATGYINMLRSHTKEWDLLMPADSIDSFRLPDGTLPTNELLIAHQVSAVVNPFHLLQNTVGERAVAAVPDSTNLKGNSISVCGLSSDCYAGMIFWDADLFMGPPLVAAFPDAAQQITNYRIDKYGQAKRNAQDNYESRNQSQKTFPDNSAIYPWTSGRYGNCTATGPCFDYEYHLNGDIALQMTNQYIVTGDTPNFQQRMFPIFDSIAETYSTLLDCGPAPGKNCMLHNATDPDEFANQVTNPAFTMALIQSHLQQANRYREQFGQQMRLDWEDKASRVDIPYDYEVGFILEAEDMPGNISVKQADVVLIEYLLNHNGSNGLDPVESLDFYAAHQSLDGPAMTFSIFSIVAAEVSPAGCSSYTYDVDGSDPYIRGPWFQFSEQLDDDAEITGYHPSFPFLTGMGGAMQVSVFGYLGLRLRHDTLLVNPLLPPQIAHLRYRTIFWQGHGISATSNSTHTTLTRTNQTLDSANPLYRKVIPVTYGQGSTSTKYEWSVESPLVLLNRRPDLNLTEPGNIAQCVPATSSSPHAGGQYPFSAVDGAVSSKWEPKLADQTSELMVEVGGAGNTPVTALGFDWGQKPCETLTVAFANSTDGERRVVVANRRVTVEQPYDALTALQVSKYASNTTQIALDPPVFGGRYAILTVYGNLNYMNESGAVEYGPTDGGCTVAEFAVIAGQGAGRMRRYYG